MNSLINLTNFKITSADTDMFGRLKMSSLLNFLVQSAINSADSLGFGFGSIKSQNLFWVLSRMHVKIERPLMWYESIVCETWPKDIDKILYLRDYIIRDSKGEVVVRASSAWLAIDFLTKRPKRIEGLDAELFTMLKAKVAIDEIPAKIDLVNGDIVNTVTTTYFDLDLNKHVTSSRYIDWMLDCFDVDFHRKFYPETFKLNYNKETMIAESLEVVRENIDNQNYRFEGINRTRNLSAFKGEIVFKEF